MSDCEEISGMFNIKRISDNNKTPSWIGIIESYVLHQYCTKQMIRVDIETSIIYKCLKNYE